MKLYYASGACSLSPHIVLREANLAFQLEKVDTKSHKLSSGGDFYEINPKGYVPALELDNGKRLTEGPAIVQYLADLAPNSGLAPKNGTFERYQLQEWLNFITSEIHKTFSPLFNPADPGRSEEAERGKARQNALTGCRRSSRARRSSPAISSRWPMRICSRSCAGQRSSAWTWNAGRCLKDYVCPHHGTTEGAGSSAGRRF